MMPMGPVKTTLEATSVLAMPDTLATVRTVPTLMSVLQSWITVTPTPTVKTLKAAINVLAIQAMREMALLAMTSMNARMALTNVQMARVAPIPLVATHAPVYPVTLVTDNPVRISMNARLERATATPMRSVRICQVPLNVHALPALSVTVASVPISTNVQTRLRTTAM